HVAGVIGAEDIGQGAVVAGGLVLAVEAQEGTDQMLARVASLPEAVRGTADARAGVLAKRPKPVQERRIDLPVIGVSTVQGAARAGLAGIAAPAGGALILGRDSVARAADAAGLFVWIVDEPSHA
ncbi:MAG: LpxI family protein, partial [Oceanicaulis sp.]